MNRNILLATAVAAGTGALVYFLRKRNRAVNNVQHQPFSQSRHLTDAFAKAKQNGSNGNGHRVSMSDKI